MDRPPQFFEDLDTSDPYYSDACQLRVKGNWELMQALVEAE